MTVDTGMTADASAMTMDMDRTAEHAAAAPGWAEMPFVTRIRLRSRRRVLWMRVLWGDASGTEQGLGISHAEVDRILSDSARVEDDEILFYESDPAVRRLTEEIRVADEMAASDPAWNWLRGQFGLSEHEIDLLSLAVAPEVDPWLRR